VTVKDPRRLQQATPRRRTVPPKRASQDRTGAARSRFWTFRSRTRFRRVRGNAARPESSTPPRRERPAVQRVIRSRRSPRAPHSIAAAIDVLTATASHQRAPRRPRPCYPLANFTEVPGADTDPLPAIWSARMSADVHAVLGDTLGSSNDHTDRLQQARTRGRLARIVIEARVPVTPEFLSGRPSDRESDEAPLAQPHFSLCASTRSTTRFRVP
jgi:hypothetical protein